MLKAVRKDFEKKALYTDSLFGDLTHSSSCEPSNFVIAHLADHLLFNCFVVSLNIHLTITRFTKYININFTKNDN